MVRKRKKIFFIILIFLTLSLPIKASLLLAAEYPTNPITMIIQFPAGSTSDVIARKVADTVSKDLGQPIIPINKPGGGGTLGVAELARSKPDGYTIGCATLPPLAIIPHLQTLPYDPLKDLVHICGICPYHFGLYVKGDAPWKTFEDFIDYARKNPGKVTNGNPGPGTSDHILYIRIGKDLNLDWRHIPYKGHIECVPAVLGDHIHSAIGSPSILMPHLRAGKLRLLIVTTKVRWPFLPEVPTILEKGFKYTQASYLSLVAPEGTPEPIRQKLEDAFRKAVQDPNLNKEFEEKVYETLAYVSGPEYKKFVSEQFMFYKEFLKSIGMTK